MIRGIVVKTTNLEGAGNTFYDMKDNLDNLVFEEVWGASFSGVGISYDIERNVATFTVSTQRLSGQTPSGGQVISTDLFVKLEASTYPGAGSWTDDTGNGNNATVSGATWLSDDGGIFDLDGTNDRIQIADNASLRLRSSAQFTAQVWVKFDALPGLNGQVPVIGKLSSSFAFDGYWAGLFSNGGTVRCVTNGSSVQRISTSSLTVNTGTWYLYTFVSQLTATANTTKVYINTTEYITTAHGTDGYNETNPLYLGYIGDGVGSAYLNGKIGAFYFYTRGLSSAEVADNYNATKTRYGL
jgi:hypothetical protein